MVKNSENQHLKGYDILSLLLLLVVTIAFYARLSSPIFTSEKISPDQIRAEVLAYQAAQIFMMKNTEKKSVQSRFIASEGPAFEGFIGEDSRGKPFRYRVIRLGDRSIKIELSKDFDQPAMPPEPVFELEIDLAKSSET